MSHDIHLAFAHPSERSVATSQGQPLDRISVRDLVVEVEIGAFQAERGTRQRIRFNIVVEVAPHSAADDDDVDKILSYDRITEAVEAELGEARINLLETLAERVAERILREPQAQRTFVRIEKLDRGPSVLGVEIVRARASDSPVEAQEDASDGPLARVVLLRRAAMDSEHLSAWIDQFAASELPLILCVDAPDEPGDPASHAMVQRRIDLLRLEEQAWRLADRDGRCVVVDSLTELDWSLKNGQIAVWAPSKVVLNAVDGPQGSDPEELMRWFSEHMNAGDVQIIGDRPGDLAFDKRALPALG
ncbi:MAG: dihydroneopterin aldolase [Pseudomonadota bacterium]